MNVIALAGLDGTNPLHVLAALGALVLTEELGDKGAKLGWARVGGVYAPRLVTTIANEGWCEAIANLLRSKGAVKADEQGPTARKRVDGLRKQEKVLNEQAKALRGELVKEATARGLRGNAKKTWGFERIQAMQEQIEAARRERSQAEEALAVTLGFGPAHLGEIVGVPASVFRLHAAHALEREPSWARQLTALASDGCLEDNGNVTPTPYSFSNGSSGKKLLKDFRTLAGKCTGEKVAASVLRGEPTLEDETALNWDPRDLRSYAHQWQDPADARAQTDVAANALAYVGLGLLPCFPGDRGLEAVGFLRQGRTWGFTWPLWEPMLSADLVQATIASVAGPGFGIGAHAVRARGLLAVYRSERVNPTGKRNFFAPAEPLS